MRYLGFVILFVVIFSVVAIVVSWLGHAFDQVLKAVNASDVLSHPLVKGSLTVYRFMVIAAAVVIVFASFAYTRRRT